MRVSESLINEEHDIMERVSGLPIDALALAVMSNLWRASQAFRNEMEQQILRDYNLTFSSFSTLFIVWIWGPLGMSAIAESQSVARSTISSTVNGLEKKGWVNRVHMGKDGDGRSVKVELTADGRALIEEVFPKFNAGEKSFVDGLSKDEAETLAFLLRKLLLHKK